MSDQLGDEQATLIHQKITPEKVEQQAVKNQPAQKKPELQKRGESDVQSSLIKSQSDDSLKGKVDLGDSIVDQEGQQNVIAQQKVLIPENFFYPEDHREEVHNQGPIPQFVVRLDGFFGHDSFKRYNAFILDPDTIIYASGISYTIYNHFTKDKKMFYSRDKGGIAAISVHPLKKYFAVAEKGVWPRIYIYEYPSLKLYRIMRKGTEASYSAICFSHSGDMLASVGSNPDYMLNVWDWKQEQTLLKSKAFSQEVYRVTFSQFNQKWLTTSGTGHIRFWKIAETFTGLKLQGQIAKFGLIQLSDVSSYAQFDDGKVLSSSEYGKLLLWEGNMIKSVIGIDEENACHKGAIEYIKLMGDKIITAGADGYIRFWDFNTINTGESDDKFNFYLKPQKEIYFTSPLDTPACLNWIQMSQNYWIVQDALGVLYKYFPTEDKRQVIMTFNSGRFNDFAMSPLNNSCVTVGYDGFVRLWDYGNKRQFYARKFPTRAQSTCVQWFPFSKKNGGRTVVVGFSDGLIRSLLLNEKGFLLLKAFKVHKNSISKVKINREGNVLVVADNAGSLFFIAINPNNLTDIKPYCLFETGFKINDLCWDRKGDKILIACQDGRLHQIDVPLESACNFGETYLRDFTSRSYTIKMMESQKPNKQDLQLQLLLKKTKGANIDDVIVDEEWQPAPILNAVYFDSNCDKILCSVDGKFLGHYYIVDFNKERPVGSLQASTKKTSFIGLLEEQDLLFTGFRNGSWEVRHKRNPSLFLRKECYDQDYGVVKRIATNVQRSAILSLSNDGTMISHKFDIATFLKGTKGDAIEEVQVTIPSVILGISEATFVDKIDVSVAQTEKDITDNTIYSLQDEKLKAEEDQKMSQAQKIKDRKLLKIKELQGLFKDIVEVNNKETDYLAKLTPEELIVDPEYAQAFQKRIEEEEEETLKELAWEEEYSKVANRKLQQYYIHSLQSLKFRVKGIKTNTIVSSFKIKKLLPFVQREIQSIEKIIEEEKMLESKDRKDRTQSNFAQSKALMEMSKIKDGKKGPKQENLQVKNKIKEAEVQFQKELAHAIATKGDYKLKTSKDYVVPQNERLNVSRKKKHLFLHYQYLYMEKQQFNNRLRALRVRKAEMVNKLNQINNRLRAINKELNEVEEDFCIEIDAEVESVEEEIVVTQNDISEHLLQKQREKEASKKTGMGMGSNQPPPEDKKIPQKEQKVQKVQEKLPKQQRQSLVIKGRPNAKVKRSALEDEIIEIKKIKLKAQRHKIKSDLSQEIQTFDRQLDSLRSLKYRLKSDLTLVEMKILTFSQEFIIFRDMEVYDNKLMETLNNFSSEKNNLQDTFVTLSTQISELQSATEQIRRKYDEQKKIFKEFVYPDDEEMRQRIIRYYKIRQRKRINRLKKQAEVQQREKESQIQENSDEQQQQEEEQEDEEESEDEFQDEDQKPDITVIQNDHKNFERVRKICEYDQKIQQNSRKKSELEKQRHQITNKIKNITSELSKAQNQLISYQKKKLQKVNQLIVTYPVKFSQIEYNVNIKKKLRLHQDLSGSILFTRSSFKRLGDRIQQLKREKIDIEKKQKNLNKKLTKLTDSVHKASIEIQNRKKDYQQKQLLKFGSTFELQKLKELEPTPDVLQLREIFKKQQRQVSNKIESIKQQLQTKKRQLLETKRQNTKVITDITQLGDRENDLKKKLDSTNKQLFKNYDVSKKDELEKQRQNLKDLIKFLSKEIEDLKTEIGLFKRKGGHIYTMVTSNKKNFS